MLVPLGLLVTVLATRAPATTRAADSPLVGKATPDLAGTTIDGARFDLASPPGRWILVNFFATWCVPCRREHPELIAFHERHQALGDAEVVGVAAKLVGGVRAADLDLLLQQVSTSQPQKGRT